MQRIDDPSAASSLPTPEAAGTPGFWTEGSPGGGVPATLVRASFLNLVQEELMSVVLAAGLTPSKTAYNQVLTAVLALSGVKTVKRQVITTSGTYTPSAGMLFADVQQCGAGAGAGSAFGGTAPNVSAAGGGGGGGYSQRLYTAAQIGASAAVVIGAGGNGGAAGQNNGTAGGASSFTPAGTGAALSQAGGTPSSYGVTSGSNTLRSTDFGSGGVGTGGQMNLVGGPGQWGVMFGASSQGMTGQGGGSVFGQGGQQAFENIDGNDGTGYGSGGSGGGALTTSRKGGNGKPGVCVITEYCSQ